ncbi:MAG: GNAT family N-acetyltransferase [Planctomycetes bacterium]|nr:GNAT family N-acetyltransferase [Planctomycetota bacterium]
MHLRELRASDREVLATLIRGSAAFREDEIEVALELIDAGLDSRSGYLFVVAADEHERALGYACYGLTPLTDGVYDLYWIVVDAARQRSGVGRQLLEAVKRDARARHGRCVIIETSGKPSYASQRAFYERCGCEMLARYPDFYRVGDDKLVYMVRL